MLNRVNMFTKKDNDRDLIESRQIERGRGRPPGTTQQGLATRRHLYETAIQLIAMRGYEATTLRDVAHSAGVSVGLLYKYFPSKRAVVLSLYDDPSAEYARRGAAMESGKWRNRFLFALQTSLDVLRPNRETLITLIPVAPFRSEEHTSELQSQSNLVCRLLLEKKKQTSELQSQSNVEYSLLLQRKNEVSSLPPATTMLSECCSTTVS